MKLLILLTLALLCLRTQAYYPIYDGGIVGPGPYTPPCPQWSPTITSETNASGYPNLTTQNNPNTITTGDSICEVAVVEDCKQYTRYSRGDQVFAQNFKRNLDLTYYGGRIIAYRIQWSSGWSGWFVPGVNDVDPKQTSVGSVKYLRRYWAYFSDHTHSFILCK